MVPATRVLPKPETATAGPDATNTSVEATMTIPKTRRLMLDSVAPNPVNGRRHLKEIKTAHLAWTEYSIDLAKFTAAPTSLPTIPTEVVGSLNRPVS